jgi:serine/threonine-protein kinase RsbW
VTEPGARGTAPSEEAAPPHARLVMQVRNRLDALEPAQQRLSSFLTQHGVAGKPLFACEGVLEELLVNLINHAFDDGQDHLIDVQVDLRSGEVQLQFTDDGRAFDATAQAEPQLPSTIDEARPGGLGLLLVRRWAQGLDYQRDGARNRLSVSIANPGPAAVGATGSAPPP